MNKKLEKILVVTTDFITINSAFLVYSIIRLHSGWFSISSIPEILPAMLVVYFYWLIMFTFVGMYRTWFASSRLDELSVLFKASFVGVFILFFLIFMSDYSEGNNVGTNNRILIFIYWLTLLIFTGVGRLFIRSFQRGLLLKGIGRRSAIIVGYNPVSHEVHRDLLKYRYYGFDAVGYAAMKETNVGKSYKGVKVLGTVKDISRLIDDTQAKEVIIALEKKNNDV
ncbi:MAG: sugar transferase, partial [Bacteroidota bacterium]|nr:sugar transferase [Bacteroidota bacterium]